MDVPETTSNSENTLEKWFNEMEPHNREVTEAMRNWMKDYREECGRPCCWSPDCGSLRCGGCGCLLSGPPPKLRFFCIECPYADPKEFIQGPPLFCQSCFENTSNPSLQHQHLSFLAVSSVGAHSLTLRAKETYTKPIELTDEIFASNSSPWPEDSECVVCCCDSFPRACYPYCGASHGVPDSSFHKGVIDSGEYMCVMCMQTSFKQQKLIQLEKITLCQVCNFEKEKEGWKNDFGDSANLIRNYFGNGGEQSTLIQQLSTKTGVKGIQSLLENSLGKEEEFTKNFLDALKKFHKQKWLHELADGAFSPKQN